MDEETDRLTHEDMEDSFLDKRSIHKRIAQVYILYMDVRIHVQFMLTLGL